MALSIWDSLFYQDGYTVISKKRCPWSKKAKALLKRNNIAFVCIELSKSGKVSDSVWGYQSMKKKFNIQTFPLIFNTEGKRIGGYTDLKEHMKQLRSRR